MKKNNNSIYRIIIVLFLFLLFIVISCANSGRNNKNFSSSALSSQYEKHEGKIKGEYVVKAKNNCDEFLLRKFFYEYGILKVRTFKNNKFIIKFANDPGLKVLKKEAEKTNTIEGIQPNYLND